MHDKKNKCRVFLKFVHYICIIIILYSLFMFFFSCFHNYLSKKCIIIYIIYNIFMMLFFRVYIIMYLKNTKHVLFSHFRSRIYAILLRE